MTINNLVCIQGPTASGKTNIAIKVANYFKSDIISADSRQFYQEMTIGTAKPTKEELSKAKHHFINNCSVKNPLNASDFEKEGIELLNQLFSKNQIPILVGGSGLYIDAIVKGFNPVPDVSPKTRQRIINDFETKGLDPLIIELKKVDEESYKTIDLKNFRRVLRALEVSIDSGKPYSEYLKKNNITQRNFKTIQVGLHFDLNVLYDRINRRCDLMLENGLLNEVKELLPYQHLSPLKTIGYQEFFDYLNNKCDFEFAVEKFKQHSRNYAKKQMTWLRRDKNIYWFDPTNEKSIFSFLNEKINQ